MNETKVICPVCGSEIAIAENQHIVNNATVIGKDSGLGTVVLPISKAGTARAEQLAKAGIDTSKYFAISAPDGAETLMHWVDGKPVAVEADDPVMAAILATPTVPNRKLFRRWVMSQVFHGLVYRDGFASWLKCHGYNYQWDMLLEELRVQAKLERTDPENFKERNRWFNKDLVASMIVDYWKLLKKEAENRPVHKCKGVPYISINKVNYFVSDLYRKLFDPIFAQTKVIGTAADAETLYKLTRQFCHNYLFKMTGSHVRQCPDWVSAYKGVGAYSTMKNLLLFHGCAFPKNNDFYSGNLSNLQMLKNAADAYAPYREGWRLFGLMKQMLEENNVDILAKMKEWATAKAQKSYRK